MSALEEQVTRVTCGLLSSVRTAAVFAAVSLVSLPAVLQTGSVIAIVSWFSQNFVQLVALALLGAGQNKEGAETRALLGETHDAVLPTLQAVHQIATEIHTFHTEAHNADQSGTQAEGRSTP